VIVGTFVWLNCFVDTLDDVGDAFEIWDPEMSIDGRVDHTGASGGGFRKLRNRHFIALHAREIGVESLKM